jgi:acetoin utilization deacetylase AcuC-like enzyme
VHAAANYPFHRATSDLDVDLKTGTGDDEYLSALDAALATAIERSRPELVFYLAGADPWEGDRLGRLSLTKAGLAARDDLVLDRAVAAGAAVCVCLAGGYAPDVRDTVEINLATVHRVARRASAVTPA